VSGTNTDEPTPAVPGGPLGADTDQDRGVRAGILIGVAMFAALQLVIAGAYTMAIRGEHSFFAPLRFAGFTQWMYVAPTLLLFVNRRCPKMASGVAIVAGAVFFGNLLLLVLT
jgi:hypothetical protein